MFVKRIWLYTKLVIPHVNRLKILAAKISGLDLLFCLAK
jgi:hypothetical protein